MSRRLIFPLLFGLVGTATLLALGVWQLQRLEWKLGVIAAIEARLAAPPVPLPANPTEAADEYRRVRAKGTLAPGEIHVYTSVPGRGVGYRVIASLDVDDGRRILIDRGFIPIAAKDAPRRPGPLAVEGSLLWPDEASGSAAPPDLDKNVWIARDVGTMAATLGTLPVLLVVAESTPAGGPIPLPVTPSIRNDHLGYAVTWFGLAAVWAVMTVLLLWRIKPQTSLTRPK